MKIEVNTYEQTVSFNGVPVSFAVLNSIFCPREDRWYRYHRQERDGVSVLIVNQKLFSEEDSPWPPKGS